MAAARTAMAAATHMPKTIWSHAVLDAADKGNYLATAKIGKLQANPNTKIARQCPKAQIRGPRNFLPWGKKISTIKYKKKLESRKTRVTYES